MNDFKTFGIKPKAQVFTGDKIKIDRILNKQVTVHGFKIDDSKITGKGNGKCLTLQVEVDGQMRVVFTGSVTLQDMIGQVPADKIPFLTTIIKESERLEFS